jgi:hypothetical protein
MTNDAWIMSAIEGNRAKSDEVKAPSGGQAPTAFSNGSLEEPPRGQLRRASITFFDGTVGGTTAGGISRQEVSHSLLWDHTAAAKATSALDIRYLLMDIYDHSLQKNQN